METQTLPELQPSLADQVERRVLQRTSGQIRNLRVELYPGEIVLCGRTTTYYAKQLATHAALDIIENITLTNEIEVQ